jgi:hypothetical protein
METDGCPVARGRTRAGRFPRIVLARSKEALRALAARPSSRLLAGSRRSESIARRQSRRILGRHDHGGVSRRLCAGDVGRHDGCPGRHRLEERQRHPLPAGRGDDDVRGTVLRGGVIDGSAPLDPIHHAQRGGDPFEPDALPMTALSPDESDPRRPIGHQRQGADRDILTLLLAQPSDTDDQLRSVDPFGARPIRRESSAVHPVRQQHTGASAPSTIRPSVAFPLRHGDDRVAATGERALDPPVETRPSAPNEP